MTVTLELKPSVEAAAKAEAQAQGITDLFAFGLLLIDVTQGRIARMNEALPA